MPSLSCRVSKLQSKIDHGYNLSFLHTDCFIIIFIDKAARIECIQEDKNVDEWDQGGQKSFNFIQKPQLLPVIVNVVALVPDTLSPTWWIKNSRQILSSVNKSYR